MDISLKLWCKLLITPICSLGKCADASLFCILEVQTLFFPHSSPGTLWLEVRHIKNFTHLTFSGTHHKLRLFFFPPHIFIWYLMGSWQTKRGAEYQSFRDNVDKIEMLVSIKKNFMFFITDERRRTVRVKSVFLVLSYILMLKSLWCCLCHERSCLT